MDLNSIKKEISENKALLIDVREKKEWDEAHLVNAQHCPLSELRKDNFHNNWPKDKTLYIHCQSGGRATTAEEILKIRGYLAQAVTLSFAELLNNKL